ncbi:MAG: hypothetical protein Q8O42_11185 [Acidobacteriota bacterium]|nr:hypothetical protein [Acidobacteriota bacterium]
MSNYLFAALLLFGMTVGVSAHEKFKIVGTIVKVQATQLDVKAVDGATYEIDMNEGTHVMQGLKRLPQSVLRPGLQVTVDALGHDMFDLEAVLVTLAPSALVGLGLRPS